MSDAIPPPAPGPTALVCGGGGARAAYQVGVLCTLAERLPDHDFPIITGVSAGAINAAGLAGHHGTFRQAVERLERGWLRMSVSSVFKVGLFQSVRSLARGAFMFGTSGRLPTPQVRGIFDTRPLRRLLEEWGDTEAVDFKIREGRLRAFALSATSFATGRTVTFIHGCDGLPTWRRAGRQSVRARITASHIMASSALPLIFPAVPIGQQFFGDGSIRQMAPLAPAIHLGGDRILAVSVRHVRRPGERQKGMAGYPPPAQVLGLMFNAVFLDALDADAERLERVNRSLAQLSTGREHPEGLRPIRLEVLRPSRDLGELAQGLGKYLPPPLRMLVRGLGRPGVKSGDFLSYLLFERPYIERLIELGREDAATHWDRIESLIVGRDRVHAG